ncbi:DUF3800 domain-containing protein [Sphingobacterium prati]|uniref:DUF3800 domain-containing protein n=1 Tax=Sphingobacterium prati TaxID=2737006 RepID=UPI00155751EC|nr:DUF3800 domain-containing protein [Sphingobacterium prati]NPE47791.1 DUF3800 domain-containing protein [Sphingobacterium prati]
MYLMYVDESGDVGLHNSPTRYFVLSAIVIHELRWRQTLENLVEFRRFLRDSKGLKLRDEIHCTELISRPGDLIRIKRNDRLDIIKKCIDWLNIQTDLNIFSVVVDKQGRTDDIFQLAWNTLVMRFENTISNKNFRGPSNTDDKGIILSDNTEGQKLRTLLRKMRHYNTIPNNSRFYESGYRNLKINSVIEDPVFRDSQYSFLHQMNDVLAYCVRQRYQPNSYMKKKGGNNFYKRLENVIVKEVTSRNTFGIVEI